MSTPTQVDNVDQATRDEWNNFLTTVQRQGGGVTATADTVRAYLMIRRRTLEGISQQIRAGEDILRRNL